MSIKNYIYKSEKLKILYFFQLYYIEKIGLSFHNEGFRTPSVHRGRVLPSCTDGVLLSGSGPEWKMIVLFF